MVTRIRARSTNMAKSTTTAIKTMVWLDPIPSGLEVLISVVAAVSREGTVRGGGSLVSAIVWVRLVVRSEAGQTGEWGVSASKGVHAELGMSSLPPATMESWREIHSFNVALSSVTFSTSTSVLKNNCCWQDSLQGCASELSGIIQLQLVCNSEEMSRRTSEKFCKWISKKPRTIHVKNWLNKTHTRTINSTRMFGCCRDYIHIHISFSSTQQRNNCQDYIKQSSLQIKLHLFISAVQTKTMQNKCTFLEMYKTIKQGLNNKRQCTFKICAYITSRVWLLHCLSCRVHLEGAQSTSGYICEL